MIDFTPEQRERYQRAANAMQSGVAIMMDHGLDTSPKQLRVGVNSAMVETATLATLLVAGGVCTAEAYVEAVIAQMEREVAIYEREIETATGSKVTLI